MNIDECLEYAKNVPGYGCVPFDECRYVDSSKRPVTIGDLVETTVCFDGDYASIVCVVIGCECLHEDDPHKRLYVITVRDLLTFEVHKKFTPDVMLMKRCAAANDDAKSKAFLKRVASKKFNDMFGASIRELSGNRASVTFKASKDMHAWMPNVEHNSMCIVARDPEELVALHEAFEYVASELAKIIATNLQEQQ